MKKFLKEYLPYIIVIVIVILVRTYVVTLIKVNGSSMDRTLKDGEIMLLYKTNDITYEDIVVIDKKFMGTSLIKRLIAMPGDTVVCTNGIIYINGEKYDDPYAYGKTPDFDLVKLKKDEYFVLGDNRLGSQDSRVFGPVNEKYIIGKTNFIVYPLNKFGKVD